LYESGEENAGLSTAHLAMKLREASLRMTAVGVVWGEYEQRQRQTQVPFDFAQDRLLAMLDEMRLRQSS
jgi:hypothetical protein